MDGYGIKTKISLTVLTTVTLLIIIISYTLFIHFHNLLKNSVLSQQSMLVTEIANQLNGRIEMAQRQLSLLAKDLSKKDLQNPASVQRILGRQQDARLAFDSGFLVTGRDGRILAESPAHPERIGKDMRFRKYVSETMRTGKPFISEPYRAGVAPYGPVVTFAEPIKDAQGEIIGVLAGRHALGVGQFLTSLSNSHLGSSGYLYILHGRTLVMHPETSRILEFIPEGKNPGVDKALKGFEGSLENYNSRGVHLLSSFKRVGKAEWVIAANIPYDIAFKPLRTLAVKCLVISAAGILIAISVIYLVIRRLVSPVEELTAHIVDMDHTNKKWVPIVVKTGDEIEDLAAAFNEMMEDVQAANQQIAERNLIYRIVAEFTNELAIWRNPDGSMRYISPNCLHLTGYSDTDFYADPVLFDSLIHDEDRQKWAAHADHGPQAGAELFIRIVNKQGHVVWFNHACHKVFDDSGVFLGVRGNFSDITVNILMGRQLAEESQFIENIINSASAPIFVIDRCHKVLYWNKSIAAMTGCSAGSMKGTDRHWTLFYKNRRPTLADLVLDGRTGFDGMYGAVRPSKYADGGWQAEGWYEFCGSNRYLRFEAAPVMDSDGAILAAVETFEDITEHVLLEEGQHKLLRVVEQSPVTIVITNLDGIIEYVNPKFSQTTGYSAQEAVGQHTRILKSGEMSPEGYADLWKTISTGREWRGEFHNKRRDGSLYWEFASISPLLDKEGAITGYLAVKEDITARKEIEANLVCYRQELENKHTELELVFRQVEQAKREWEVTLDHLRDFVILTDADHHVRRYNKLLVEISGKNANELAGQDWRNLLKDAGFTIVPFNETSGEVFHERSARSYDLNIYKIQENETLTGFVVSINDTTELRLAGQELQKAYADLKDAQMQIFQQEKMASIGQLAAGVAHEINNPMGFISSNLGSLGKYVDRFAKYIAAGDLALSACGDSAELSRLHELGKKLKIEYIIKDARQLIDESQDGAERVRRIVQDLKSFSRVDQAEKGLVNINEALETTINIAWNEIKYVAALNRDFGDIPEVFCFPQQLNQVFLNLLVNAAQAIGENQGAITVRTWSDDDQVYVSVADTGCGIPEEIQQRIFEPFFTTKEVGKGTGLGLSISYEIIRRHGGEIRVESEAGHGTTFIVSLPLDRPGGRDVEHA